MRLLFYSLIWSLLGMWGSTGTLKSAGVEAARALPLGVLASTGILKSTEAEVARALPLGMWASTGTLKSAEVARALPLGMWGGAGALKSAEAGVAGTLPLEVLATTSFVAHLVQTVGGPTVRVHALMGPRVDPHIYRASVRDIRRLRQAQLIFYNGLHLEGRLQGLLKSLKQAGKNTVAVSSKLPAEALLYSKQGQADPHIWLDPLLWGQCAQTVAEALGKARPHSAWLYRENAESFARKCQRLSQLAKERLSRIPVAHRILVTSHDAFAYFGRAFKLKVIGVQGISTASRAGLADIAAAIDLVRQNGLPSVFVESSTSPLLVKRIVEHTAAALGGTLFSDAMGGHDHFYSEEVDGLEKTWRLDTYEGVFLQNIATILAGLGGANE